MRTLDEAAKIDGVTKTEKGLNLHFSSLPNWYTCFSDVNCPICDNPISWEWDWGKNGCPQITTHAPENVKVKGAALFDFGHRWLVCGCEKCGTKLFLENFD